MVKININGGLFLLAMLLPVGATAQEAENLIPNGNFEEFGTGTYKDIPVTWQIEQPLFPKCETSIVHGGSKALRMYLNGATFGPNYTNPIPVVSGNKYELSFWYYGNSNRNVIISLYWYKGTQYIQSETFNKFSDKIRAYTEWQEKKREIQVPEGINGVAISIKLLQEYGDKYIIFDDFSLKSIGAGDNTEVPQPKALKAVSYQREMELTWENVAAPGTTWEVETGGKTLSKITPPASGRPSFTVENLKPGTSYTFNVYTVDASGKKSKPASITETTPYLASKDDEERIPFLRTIPRNGFYNPQINGIRTYFTDLYEENASISYLWDGIPVVPVGNWLAFGASNGQKNHVLKVHIVEADGQTWDLEYRLTVIN